MTDISAIQSLLLKGWSRRKVARRLGIDRETVGKYARALHDESLSKPAKVTPGTNDSKPAKVTPGSPRSRSACEPFREAVESRLEAGLSARRIYQDLTTELDFGGSYESVKRFVRGLRNDHSLPFRRLETAPAEEAQVDFGTGAFVVRPGKSRRRPHLFRIVLSHSRKAYSEVVWRQTTESFIRCIENSFRKFGGVPETLVIDNLKAAVSKADWFDPDINPKFRSFAKHYGFAILPTKPYTPRHKGKVEAGVKYAQENALKGRSFKSLEEQNLFLDGWESQVADTRIHGTTRRQVREIFEKDEKGCLRPLASTPFPCFEEGERKVHRDGHIALNNAFYSVPPEYLAKPVWVRWDEKIVRVYNNRFQQIAIHPKAQPGQFQTHASHIDPKKISSIEKGAQYLLRKIELIGPHCASWSQELLNRRGIEGMRTLQGFLMMTEKTPWSQLERAAQIASSHESYRLRSIRRIVKEPEAKQQLTFLDEHPVIRSLDQYEGFVQKALQREERP